MVFDKSSLDAAGRLLMLMIYFVDIYRKRAESWCKQSVQSAQQTSSENIKHVIAFAKDNPSAVIVSGAALLLNLLFLLLLTYFCSLDEFKPPISEPIPLGEARPVPPPIPQPRWIDLYLIPKIVIGIYLFGANLNPSLQIAGKEKHVIYIQ